jgi:transcriptional regulator with XRE-family HTH domain
MPEQPTLSDMIRQEVDKGVTYAELEERATDPATGRSRISDSQLNRLAKGTATRIPTEEQLRGIAAALRIPYERVRGVAIAQWLPAEVEESDEQVLARIDELQAQARQLQQQAAELRGLIDEPERPQSA